MKINFNSFNKATIKKEYLKDSIKYLELTYYDEESNKLYVFNMSYKRYLLQKYLGYLIPSNHKIIPLDKNEENFDIFNLGIRDEYNESPVYKGWEVISIRPKGTGRIDKTITIKKDKSKEFPYHHYLYEQYLGRLLLSDEIFIFKDNDRTNLDINNFILKRFPVIVSRIYPSFIVRGPYGGNDDRNYVRIIMGKKELQLSYAKFLMQEYLGRELETSEYVKLKEPNNFDLSNMILCKTNYFTSVLYKDVKMITGPYYKKRGRKCNEEYERQRVRIWFNDNTILDISYPKFILQEHLERFLTEDETIHHKDGDYYNNEIDNLEILSRSEHAKLDVIRLKLPTIVCQVCNKSFVLSNTKFNKHLNRSRKNKNYIGPFCSISCDIEAKKYPELYQNILPKKEYVNHSKTYEFDEYIKRITPE